MHAEIMVVSEKINKLLKDIINNDLPDIIRKSDQFKALQKFAPEIDEIVLAVGWSGYCDGDREYPVCIPLFIESDHNINCCYKTQDQDENIKWDKDSKTDKYLKEIFENLSEGDKYVFQTNYYDICNEVFCVIGDVYSVGDIVRIKVSSI